jgi:hypothetical protein
MHLSRKQAIYVKAIPKQVGVLVMQGIKPTWEEWTKTEGWKQTIENLQLTEKDKQDYQTMWNAFVDELVEQVMKNPRRYH